MKILEKATSENQCINPWKWKSQLGFVQAVKVIEKTQVLYCSGQASIGSEGLPVHTKDMRIQIEQALANLETVLDASGFKLSDVVRLNYYTTDIDMFFDNYDFISNRMAEAGATFSSTLLEVSRLASPQLMIEIEATAVK